MSKVFTSLKGIVASIIYHNPDNGWSVLRVQTFNDMSRPETVIVHQIKVFAGATMEFTGSWITHPKYGRQFKAINAVEKKPATTAALEKYLGSGLIRGVGPRTAKKIVNHFKSRTLDIFEEDMEKLKEVPGIAEKKLGMISDAWTKHKAVRDVMLFLQTHGISTLFAVRIYREYGNNSIQVVTENPYRLADDFYGIGFFSADKVALSIGFERESVQRISAGIKHVLAASRESGHCFLTAEQINAGTEELLGSDLSLILPGLLDRMEKDDVFMVRNLALHDDRPPEKCYYTRSLYFDELYIAKRVRGVTENSRTDPARIARWLERFARHNSMTLSEEQLSAVEGIACKNFSILTGGPGCGKTTVTFVLVRLLEAMKKKVLLAAPTGRAAQRMSDVIGRESKTIHRLLKWKNGRFSRNEEDPLEVDFIIIDECSMLDIAISASLLKAIPPESQILFIGDADQLPPVGAGNVLKDLILSEAVPVFELTKVFRQARESLIISCSHRINRGMIPKIDSPFKHPELWKDGSDCLFIDSEEATQEQINFIQRVKKSYSLAAGDMDREPNTDSPYEFRTTENLPPRKPELNIPEKFFHVDVEMLAGTKSGADELKEILKSIHPWSSLRYGLTASDVIRKLYTEWIPKFAGREREIQVLTPMTRGSLGTVRLNRLLQESVNPSARGKYELKTGDRIFRVGDRVIHRRNNYTLGVFNGDIGKIESVDNESLTCTVSFSPDNRQVIYQKENIIELDLAYAITIHKAQGSEFETIVIPVTTQHYKMLFRNLIYTGLTRAKKLAILVGTRRALAMAVKNMDTALRQTALQQLIRG